MKKFDVLGMKMVFNCMKKDEKNVIFFDMGELPPNP